MENYSVIYNIFEKPTEWNSILKHALNLSDRFAIVFPNGEYDEENPLLTGKPDFDRLSNLTVESWPKMADSTLFSGVLNRETRGILYKYMNETPEKTTGSLWNFSLFQNEVELLNVQDFNVCTINLETDLIQILGQKNVDYSY